VRATVRGRTVRAGSERFMAREGIDLPPIARQELNRAQAQGSTLIYVSIGNLAAGVMELRPRVRKEAREIIANLNRMRMDLFILSGDSAATTDALAAEVGIERYFAEILPGDKARILEDLRAEGRRVCFVGDGAPGVADISVSLRGPSDLRGNAADVILMDGSLRQLPAFFEGARGYRNSLRTLLATTFIPGFVSAAGVLVLGTGNTLALGLFNLSMIAAVVNAVWPALHHLDPPAPARPEGPNPESAPPR